jgi:CRP/FNR family transcriptional regulator
MDFAEAAAHVPFLRALTAADIERLRPSAQVRRVARGERIWREGAPTAEFTFLADGRVKLVRSGEAGREVIVDVCGTGQLLCGSAVCGFAPYCCSATALEDAVEVIVVPRREILDLLETSPDASRAFLREFMQREQGLTQRIAQLSTGQVDRRLAALFVRLAEQVGTERDDGSIWVPVTLSRQDLADLCGTTIETTIRTMTRFARQGVVRTVGRGFVVADRSRLEAVVRGE